MIRPCMSGRNFLYERRPPVHPFPMSRSFSPSESYECIRHLRACAFPVGVLRSRSPRPRGDNLWGFPGSMMCLFIHATAYSELPVLHILALTGRRSVGPYSLNGCFCVGFGTRYSPPRPTRHFGALSTFGSHGAPTACTMLCVRVASLVRRRTSRLRHRRNTRYGWMASPSPTGTFTLQGTPSFAWRANATLVLPTPAPCRSHET